jgi:hypothetical protein
MVLFLAFLCSLSAFRSVWFMLCVSLWVPSKQNNHAWEECLDSTRLGPDSVSRSLTNILCPYSMHTHHVAHQGGGWSGVAEWQGQGGRVTQRHNGTMAAIPAFQKILGWILATVVMYELRSIPCSKWYMGLPVNFHHCPGSQRHGRAALT